MATRRKSIIWRRRILVAALVASGSFGIGFFLPLGRPAVQGNGNMAQAGGGPTPSLLPIPQLGIDKKKDPQPTTVQAVAKQHVESLNSQMLVGWEQEAKAKSAVFTAPKRSQAKMISDIKLSDANKVVALTFDDGPAPKYTEQILDILKKNNIKATFFWVGEMVQDYPQIAQKVIAEGHAIGNHTWHHWYRRMDAETAKSEVERTAAVIYKTTGVRTSLFRPPGGILNNGVVDYALKNNYAIMMWSADSIDYSRPSVDRLVNNVLKHLHPGGIALMHDGGGNRSNTVEALPEIIKSLTERGYRFVTVPELLELQREDQHLQTATKPGPTSGTTNIAPVLGQKVKQSAG